MPISYKNVPITINGVSLFATNATLDQTQNVQALRSLGKSEVSTAVTEAPQGTISADFYITASNVVSTFASAANRTGSTLFDCAVGGITVSDCLYTAFSVQADANALINGSISLDYYGSLAGIVSGSASAGTVEAAHGAKSTGSNNVGFNAAPYSFNYELSKEYAVNRTLGSAAVTQSDILFTAATTTVSLEGDDLPRGIAPDPTSSTGLCPNELNASLALEGTCGTPYGILGITGLATTRSISVSENDVVRGSITLNQYY